MKESEKERERERESALLYINRMNIVNCPLMFLLLFFFPGIIAYTEYLFLLCILTSESLYALHSLSLSLSSAPSLSLYHILFLSLSFSSLSLSFSLYVLLSALPLSLSHEEGLVVPSAYIKHKSLLKASVGLLKFTVCPRHGRPTQDLQSLKKYQHLLYLTLR